MKKRIMICILILSLTTSCATGRGRFLLGVGIGGVAAGGTAALLSPNSESLGLNALVFGLIGALTGGVIAAFAFKDPSLTLQESSIKSRELGNGNLGDTQHFTIPSSPNLPSFLKERLQPAIIEEGLEPDTVSDDGTLHAPHKVYRIQRQAELFAKPIPSQTEAIPSKDKEVKAQ